MVYRDPVQVRSAINRLLAAQPNVFGARGRHFRLHSPLPESEVSAFEHRHNIFLPGDYRKFITEIGNGGPGPYYGIFPLGQMDGLGDTLETWRENERIVGTLAEPFSFRDAWNDLSGVPMENLLETDYDEYAWQMEVFEKRYWAPSMMNGAIPICHEGCALRVWLVITGPESGHLWEDCRADHRGLLPLVLKDKSRATFSSWYNEWLDELLQGIST